MEVRVTHSGSFLLDSRVQEKTQKGRMVLGEWFLQTAEGEFQRESHSMRRAVACAIVLRAGEYFYFRS